MRSNVIPFTNRSEDRLTTETPERSREAGTRPCKALFKVLDKVASNAVSFFSCIPSHPIPSLPLVSLSLSLLLISFGFTFSFTSYFKFSFGYTFLPCLPVPGPVSVPDTLRNSRFFYHVPDVESNRWTISLHSLIFYAPPSFSRSCMYVCMYVYI